MTVDDTTAAMVARYQAGATTREIGAEFGLDSTAVGKRLRKAGVAMRPRGVQAPDPGVVETVLSMRRRQKASWPQIGAAVGLSPSAVRALYLRETGDRGTVDHARHLTARQAERLVDLYNHIPYVDAGYGVSWQSAQGRRFLAEARQFRSAGITYTEMDAAIGQRPGYVSNTVHSYP